MKQVVADTLSPAELAEALDRATLMEAWISGVRDRAAHLIQQGEVIPGWELAPPTTRRKWEDEQEAVEWMESWGVEAYTPQKVISPAECERRIRALKLDEEVYTGVNSRVTKVPSSGPPRVRRITGTEKTPPEDDFE